jgi:hypothetical protein
MLSRVALVLFGSMLSLQGTSQARDLLRSDRDRAAILDTARGDEDIKFVVEDLVKDGDYAFLCALKRLPSGYIVDTDESIDVYQWAFLRHGKAWAAFELPGGLAADAAHVSCAVTLSQEPSRVVSIKGRDDIVAVTVAEVETAIRTALDFGKIDSAKLSFRATVAPGRVIAEMSIEHPKFLIDHSQVEVFSERCESSACRSANERSFSELSQRKGDAKISSVAWQNCGFGIRAGNLAAVASCVDAMSPKPYCRPGMTLPADRGDIERCISEIHDLCVKAFPRYLCQQ